MTGHKPSYIPLNKAAQVLTAGGPCFSAGAAWPACSSHGAWPRDPGQRLEQLAAARNRLVKRRELDEQKARLKRAEQRVQKTSQDLEVLQSQMNQAMAETNEATGVAKRTSEAPAGLPAVQIALNKSEEDIATRST